MKIAPRVAQLRTAATLVLAASLAACAINPVTGERELALISESQEVAMGAQAAEQVQASIGFVDDAALQGYVSEIGMRLAQTSQRPDLPWEFHVVDDATPNAFALPGGYIFVTRGLMTLLDSEAELAAVLGHEIGHVTARHSVNQISRAQLAQLGFGIGTIAAPEAAEQFGQLASQGLGLLFLKHGREDERQADDLGFQYMLQHDYDVREMEDVFVALDAASQLAGQSAIPTWLSSHPSGPERIESARARVAALEGRDAALPDTRKAALYLDNIDGLVYGQDPRHGYFEGDAFYHPELAFELRVPEQWRRQNMASAVIATSPGQDAAMQLTLAEGDARSAAATFFAAEGVQELGSANRRINDNSAIVSEFAAQTQNGVLRGLVAHIDYGPNVYRVVAYAPEAAFASQERALGRIVESFGPVRDRSVLDVEANRLRVVAVEQQMSLDEFSRRYPSVVPVEELAVINQVSGANARLDKGSKAKRVTG